METRDPAGLILEFGSASDLRAPGSFTSFGDFAYDPDKNRASRTTKLHSPDGARIKATSGQVRASLAIVAVFAVATAAIIPFTGMRGPAMAGFVPAYQMAVFLFYGLGFLHLVAHVRRSGSPHLLHIAAGCLFSALILLVQMFSFPIWGPVQLIGNTPATTSWLWCFWHLGPPLFTFSYVTAHADKAAMPSGTRAQTSRAIAWATAGAVTAVAVATAISTWALPWLPLIVTGDDYNMMTTSGVGPAVLIATLASLGLLIARTRCATQVELCLAVALTLLSMDDVLTLLGGSRLSWGWYAGRAEAAISAAVLLALYMVELNQRFIAVADQAASLAIDQRTLSQEVTKQQQANDALSFLARQDGLTLLANRRRFDEALALDWRRAQRDSRALTLLMIDVDKFKLYNDSFGHQSGDTCLQTVASVIQGVACRPGDLAARYGGEEFALLTMTDAEGGRAIADAIRTALRVCAIPHDRAHSGLVTVSIGISTMTPGMDDDNHAALIAAADHALYRAKTGGRDRAVSVTEGELAAHELNRPITRQDISLALQRKEFYLHYQPQIDLGSGKIAGCEALLRWQHPQRGLVSPGEFIPLMEQTGQIVPIGAWVLRQACADASAWSSPVRVAVNVSPIQFVSAGFAASVADALNDTGLPADRLDLEITETADVIDPDAIAEVMSGLSEMGIMLSLDDFGCGASCLAHVKCFPVSHIKIDQSFVREIERSERTRLLIRSIRVLAGTMGMQTTAEGVETEAQLAWLRAEGIDFVQGFLLSRPMRNEDLAFAESEFAPA